MYFLFCHGFGFNKNFWEPLRSYFATDSCHFIDLGYFGDAHMPKLKDKHIVAIGHSLGVTKLVQNYPTPKILIGLNSFTNFLGFDPNLHQQRKKRLKALQLNMLRDPVKALKNFYQHCGNPDFIHKVDFSSLNQTLLLQDLTLLENHISLPKIPTLMIEAMDDSIVPQEVILDNFLKQDHIKIENWAKGAHNLGFDQTEAVYNRIMDFLYEFKR